MLRSKKKYRPPFALRFSSRLLFRSVKKISLAKKKIRTTSLVTISECDAAASGSMILVANEVAVAVDNEDASGAAAGVPASEVLSSEELCDPDGDQDRDNPFILVKNRKTIPRGWNFFVNHAEDASGRIVLVWDPTVTLIIYDATAQSVTCGVSILSENISLTVTFIYGFNLVEDRRCMWNHLVQLQDSSPVSSHPCSQVDVSGMDEANIALQDAQLFEAQAKGLPFTWRNSQDDSPISTRIDHAFINQTWSSAFPDSYAEFLDPSQSDHAPCLFRVPSIRRQVIKPLKFFHHVIDHPEYAGIVRDAWDCSQITGTDQYKLVRSLKLLKRPLRRLNKRHFSGISQRVKAQKDRVDVLQRALLTTPDVPTAREEHTERDKLNILLKAEEKFYRQRSRVRWADVGDRNTPFYHRTVSSHASRNHIHLLKDANDHVFYSTAEIKAHAAEYFQGILGATDLHSSPVSSGAFGNTFSSKVTWERMRVPSPLVQWHSVAWFREEIPRCSFIAWTAFLRRLPTRDRLISWGLNVQPGFATWTRFCGRFLATPPATLDAVVVLCQHFPGPHARRAVAVMKLINQVIIYNIWRERNARIFTGVSSTQEAVFRVVDRTVRDRLLALSRPTVSAPPPSLLELYFWFLSPYS
ncbi:BnaA01g25580D [Brassica napus]|uniref:BnaA01g25580D protein n=1 Tax=Brassica napus TaxID=3708 RepID=A0A078IRD6_BRANA|nr:BnaA01g25580D [Brassica napus]